MRQMEMCQNVTFLELGLFEVQKRIERPPAHFGI
jgi:hypothetical protein